MAVNRPIHGMLIAPRLLQVKDLLELKQQQAGVVQAWQSVKYSNEAMRQGRSILVFTIVTIVFVSAPSVEFQLTASSMPTHLSLMALHKQLT